MNQGESQVNTAAFQISSWGAPAQTALNPPIQQQGPVQQAPSSPPQPAAPQSDSVDLSSAAVNLLQGKDTFDANTKVVHVADEMAKQTINMMG